MRYLLLLIFPCFCFNLAFTQESDASKKDMIILKSGVRLNGDIVEMSDKAVYIDLGFNIVKVSKKNMLKMEYNGDVSYYDFIENFKISDKDTVQFELVPIKKSDKEGWYNISYGEIHFPNDNDEGGAGVVNITGFQWNQYTGLGLGVGYQSSGRYRDGNLIPVFLEYRGYLSKAKVSAYFNLAMGVSNAFKNSDSNYTSSKPGSYFHPSFGYKIGSNEAAMMIDLGLHYSNVTYVYDNEFSYSEEQHFRRRIVLRIGVML